MKYSVAIIVVSDRAAAGTRDDLCAPAARRSLPTNQYEIRDIDIVSDEPPGIEKALRRQIQNGMQLIYTCGGTGCAPRDNTPEVTRRLLEKPTPGIDEAIRRFSEEKSGHAFLSRGVSGVAGKSLIINLPGAPKAVAEIIEYLSPTLPHALKLIAGVAGDCADTNSE